MPGFSAAAKGAQDCKVVASDNMLATDTTVQGTASTSYQVAKKVNIPACLKSGVVRTVISFRLTATAATAYGIVRIDGNDVGTERTNTTTSFLVFTEDIAIDKTMKELEFWVKTSSGLKAVEENQFSVKGDTSDEDPEFVVTLP